MQTRARHNKSNSGYTLIELMIAIAIVGIMIAPSLAMYRNARNMSEDHLLFTRAAAALDLQAEIVKTAPAEEFASGRLGPRLEALVRTLPAGEGAVEVQPWDGRGRVMRIDISISWDNPWRVRKTISTVVLRGAP